MILYKIKNIYIVLFINKIIKKSGIHFLLEKIVITFMTFIYAILRLAKHWGKG